MSTPALQSSTSLFRGESALSDGHAATGDRALLERLAASELDALDLVLAKFWSPLVRYLISILASREAAEDAAQEAFYRLWQHRRELDVEGSLRGFLYQVARNLAISERRRHLAFQRAAATMHVELDVAVSIEMKDDDLDATLRRALRTLSKRRREILLLHAVHDLSYKEIAAMLDIAPQTVANQFSAAIASLRRLLSPSSMV